jgi:hypothetical protein
MWDEYLTDIPAAHRPAAIDVLAFVALLYRQRGASIHHAPATSLIDAAEHHGGFMVRDAERPSVAAAIRAALRGNDCELTMARYDEAVAKFFKAVPPWESCSLVAFCAIELFTDLSALHGVARRVFEAEVVDAANRHAAL